MSKVKPVETAACCGVCSFAKDAPSISGSFYCCRYPPHRDAIDSGLDGRFRVVGFADWCGEFRRLGKLGSPQPSVVSNASPKAVAEGQ